MVAELRFARTCAVRYPCLAPTPRHSKASRVLPTPAGPANSAPPDSPSIAAVTCVSSATRPTNGHVAVFTIPCLPALESPPALSHEPGGGIPRYAGRFERKVRYQAMRSFRSDPDAVAGKRIDRALVRRVFRLARPYRRLLIGFLVTAIAASIVTAIPPLLFRSLLDTAVPQKDRLLVTSP